MNRFYFSRPDIKNYDMLLDLFDGTHINSVRTSSVPLVAFWYKYSDRLAFLQEQIGLDLIDADLCFEYPTSSGAKGKSSMTDLMIIANHHKIAIEAKFTEVKEAFESVQAWKSKDKSENRSLALTGWLNMLRNFAIINDIDRINQIPYQFLHRSASACKENSGQAIVIYQVFFDNDTRQKLADFRRIIENAVEIIGPLDNLRYYFWEIEVTQNVSEKEKDKVFQRIKQSEIYSFRTSKLIRLPNGA